MKIDSPTPHLLWIKSCFNAHTRTRTYIQVSAISTDLQLTRDAVTTLTQEQHAMIRDSFLLLAEKCREEIQLVATGNGQLTHALANAETSLATLQEKYEKLQRRNERLVSQKSTVSSDVSKLRAEIATLHDQKKLLEVKLSQSDTLAQQKDVELQELAQEKVKIEEKLRSNEKKWKKEVGQLQREWEGKVAMATQDHELLLDSKETLEAEKTDLESTLFQMELDNKQLLILQSEYSDRVTTLESDLTSLHEKFTAREQLISSVKNDIAKLLSEKVILSAEARIISEIFEAKLARSEREKAIESETAKAELNDSLQKLEAERTEVHKKIAKVVKKECEIDSLTTKVTVLSNEKQQLQNEIQLLSEKHAKAQQEILSLVENEKSRQLDNEKLKMTLTTEIELLKSKLKTLEEVRDVDSTQDKPSSAFQLVQQNRPKVEQLLKQISVLQQDSNEKRRVSKSESNSSRLALAELQSRLSGLEEENKSLKESANGRLLYIILCRSKACIHQRQ